MKTQRIKLPNHKIVISFLRLMDCNVYGSYNPNETLFFEKRKLL